MRRFDFVVTCVCCALLGYFAWHAWEGPRGYPYREGLEQKLAVLDAKYQDIKSKREAFERKVSLLRPESIDPDLLDELARSTLEVAKPNDLVVFTGP